MRAAVTRGIRTMEVVDVPEPPPPAQGEVIVRPEAVGICGSDYHFFSGHLSEAAGGGAFPRVQGHEVAGIVEQVGPGCPERLAVGDRVAMWPLTACGRCYPCRVGRPNACDAFRLMGIHVDGGLQERLRVAADHVFPIREENPAVASIVEPVSIAVRAANRAAVAEGERLVVLGAGPVGQSVCVVAMERGASVLVVDRLESRLGLARELGAATLLWTDTEAVVRFAQDWAGGEGPPVTVDATGAPEAVRAMVEMTASAGRAVQVGMSSEEVSLRIGSLTEKELDLLGVSCCGEDEFAEAVRVVERNRAAVERLVSHEFPLDRAPDALVYAMEHPAAVMKVVIRCDDRGA